MALHCEVFGDADNRAEFGFAEWRANAWSVECQWSGGIGKVAQWALKFCCCEAWTLSVVGRGEVV